MVNGETPLLLLPECTFSKRDSLLFLSFSRLIGTSGMPRGLSTHKRAPCARPSASLEKESPRGAMPIHTSARHNTSAACVGENSRRNISFGASCSFNQWHLWASRCASSACPAYTIARVYVCVCVCLHKDVGVMYPARKAAGPRFRARWTPKKVGPVLSIIIYRLQNLRDAYICTRDR